MPQTTNGLNKRVYFDTDVLVSSQLSQLGAAEWLIYHTENLVKSVSELTIGEFKKVCARLQINYDKKIFSDFNVVSEIISKQKISSMSEYLITFNIKDYKTDKLRQREILVIRPGEFLQYLRSQE